MALSDPAAGGVAIVPSDTVGIGRVVRSIYVGGAGNITLVAEDGSVVLFSAVPAGTILPIRTSRVNLTGTTATLMVGLL